jgi:predicted nucleotidyltransferase
MDRITDRNVKDWIDSFLAVIKEKYSPEKILLFGSRARGDHLVDSDVDMIIVSKKFEGVNWLTRIRDVSELWEGLVPLEPLCYTPAEFQEKKSMIGIVSQAAREGKELMV